MSKKPARNRRGIGIAILLMAAILGYAWYAGNLLSAIGDALQDHPNRAVTATPGATGAATGRTK